MNYLIYSLLGYSAMILIAELIFRFTNRQEIARKFAHIMSCVITAYILPILSLEYFLLLGVVFLGLFITNKYFTVLTVFSEKNRGHGDIYLVIGLALLFWFGQYHKLESQVAILVLGLADGLAAFGSKILPTHIYGSKTRGGSGVFMLITYSICLALLPHSIMIYVYTIVGTIVEGLSTKGWDNITIPLSFILITLGGYIIFL